MTTESDPESDAESDTESSASPSPQAAFSVLGDETRLAILQALGEAGEPLAFSALHDRVDYDDPSNFNYHLKKLTGHFIHKTDDGYALRQAGRRVVEAVLAEATMADARITRTRIDRACFLCGEPMAVSYEQAHVGLYCSACGGTRNETSGTTVGRDVDRTDLLGLLDLPPAGAVDRTPTELLDAANWWTTSEGLSLAKDVCPRCAAPLTRDLRVCDGHERDGDHCETCGQRFGVVLHHTCSNCIFAVTSPFGTYLMDEPALLAFKIDHGIDPLDDLAFHLSALEETVLSADPFEARFSFTTDGETLTLTVDDTLSVVDVERTSRAPETNE